MSTFLANEIINSTEGDACANYVSFERLKMQGI